MIGKCKQCGFEAGMFGLENGLCEQCNSNSSKPDTSDRVTISKAIEDNEFTGIAGLLWSILRVVFLMPIFVFFFAYAAHSYGILGATVAFIGAGVVLVKAVKILLLDIKGYKNYKLLFAFNAE